MCARQNALRTQREGIEVEQHYPLAAPGAPVGPATPADTGAASMPGPMAMVVAEGPQGADGGDDAGPPPAKQPHVEPLDPAELERRVRAIVSAGNKDELTSRKVREELEDAYGRPLDLHKKQIKQVIAEVIKASQHAAEGGTAAATAEGGMQQRAEPSAGVAAGISAAEEMSGAELIHEVLSAKGNAEALLSLGSQTGPITCYQKDGEQRAYEECLPPPGTASRRR